MSKFSDLLGTVGNFFKLGVTGPRLRNTAGVIEARNSGDTAFATLRGNQLEATNDTLELNGDATSAGADWSYQIKRPSSGQAGALVLTLPPNAGTAGQVLQTDGAGNLSFASAATTANKLTTDTTSLAFGSSSPVSMFTMPAASVVEAVRVIIDTSFAGGTGPSLSVGITGSTSKYLSSTQVDLTQPAGTVFEVYPGLPAPTSAENLIATYAANGATAGAGRIEVDYVIPS
jgi:hypothetical protein